MINEQTWSKRLTESLKEDKKVFGVFFVSSFLLYYNTFGINFLCDDYKFLYAHKQLGFNQFHNNFNDQFFLLGTHVLEYLQFKIFGLNVFYYHLIGTLFHVLNSYMIYKIIKLISSKTDQKFLKSIWIPIVTALLFLLSPYQTETVVWYAAKSYIYATFFFLLSIYCFVKYRIENNNAFLFYSSCFYLASVLFKEISIVLPVLVLAYEIFYDIKNKRRVIIIALFYLAFTIAYFLLRYFFTGEFVGGYGASVHLNFSVKLLMYNFVCYLAKFALCYRYLPDIFHNGFSFIYNHQYIQIISGFLFLISFVFIFKTKRNLADIKFFIFLTLLFAFSLLPVINLETSFLGEIQSDRYGYLPSIFFTLIIVFIFELFPQKIRFVFYSFIGIVFIVLTLQTNLIWKQSGEISERMLKSIKEINPEQDIYILNMPDNYKGAYLFRCNFAEAVKLNYPELKGGVRIVSWQNISTPDEVCYYRLNGNELTYTTKEKKDYFMRLEAAFQWEKALKFKTSKRNELSFEIHQNDCNSIYIYNSGKFSPLKY